MSRLLRTLILAACICGAFATSAGAYWTSSGVGNGSGLTATMPTATAPTVGVAGTTVNVSFSQLSIVGLPIGSLVGGGYEVRREPANGGAAVTPGGSCGALLTGGTPSLSCSETNTPRGDWRYTVRPILHSWTGGTSPASAVALVLPDAPTSPVATLAPAAAINVGWTAGAGATGYNVYRRTPPAAFNYGAPVNGATPVASTNYADGSPVSGTAYRYVIRSVVIGSAGQQIESASSAETASVTADGVAPTGVSITNPGTPLAGTITLNGAATDALSGVASVAFQYKTSAGSVWTTACTDLATPFNCSFNTASVADGNYDFRVIATDNAGNTTTSAATTNRLIDNTAPTGVTITAPAAIITGSITINAGTPTDSGSGVQSVAIQRSPAGAGIWTTICTDTAAAYSCNFASTGVSDGLYDFRALATDNAGNAATSTAVTNRRVDNTAPTATADNPGTWVRGTIILSGSGSDAGSGLSSLVLQARAVGSPTWTTLATSLTGTVSANYNTVPLANGDFELRVTATDNAGLTNTSNVSPVHVDNTPPSAATITNPGSPLRGTVAVSGGGADAYSGVQSVTIQYSPAGAGTWSNGCSDTSSPYSCNLDTTLVADGFYDLRSLVTDMAGNTLASAAITNRRVDNTPPAVTLGALGTYLRGTLALTSTATDAGSGMSNVVFQRSPAGADTWTTICTDNASPYTCNFNTTGVADGNYDIRALATDLAGNTNAAVANNRVIDNTRPVATDIQTANGGTAGRPDSGDSIIYTYSEAINPTTILAGWNGSATNVTVRFNYALAGGDTVTIYNAANNAQVAIGTVTIGDGYINFLTYLLQGNPRFDGTMTMSGNQVTVTLGALEDSGTQTSGGNRTLSWASNGANTDLAGNTLIAGTVNESGANDPDF